MKILTILIIGILVLATGIYINYQDKKIDFFEENNIEDDSPVGRDLEGYWIYENIYGELIKVKDLIPTERGLEYKKLVEEKE